MATSRPATLFESNENFGKYMFNVGAPESSILRKVAELMNNASLKRLVLVFFLFGSYTVIHVPSRTAKFGGINDDSF